MQSINLHFNPDPQVNKVVLLSICLLAEALLGGFLIVLQSGRFPSTIEVCTIIVVGLLQFFTYWATFLRTGDIPQEVKTQNANK